MSLPIVEINNLSKRYTLGANRQKDGWIREEIMNSLHRLFSRRSEAKKHLFWALKGIDLDIAEGETLGHHRQEWRRQEHTAQSAFEITPPTTGEAVLRGRVASLLEVGTGFIPSLLAGRMSILTARSWE